MHFLEKNVKNLNLNSNLFFSKVPSARDVIGKTEGKSKNIRIILNNVLVSILKCSNYIDMHEQYC